MNFAFRLLVVFLMGLTSQAMADPFKTIGIGRMFTNDYLTDGQDRWHSGSYAFSLVKGRAPWSGQVPENFGEIVELRFRSDIIAPANLVNPAPWDRPYAGILSLGIHSHSKLPRGAELSAGIDLVAAGSATGISKFQDAFHNIFLGQDPSVVFDNQISGIFPTATIEVARPFSFSGSTTIRPFVEGVAGAETFMRVGADIVLGRSGQNDLLLRDVTTGQLYRGAQKAGDGFSFIIGGDIAYVARSKFLPASDGFTLTDSRKRLRAGVHWLAGQESLFYGLTWLGPEFAAQPEGQFTGSLRLIFNF